MGRLLTRPLTPSPDGPVIQWISIFQIILMEASLYLYLAKVQKVQSDSKT